MTSLIYALLPTFVVVTVALLTHRLMAALIAGIGVCALLATHWSPFAALNLLNTRILEQITDIDTLCNYSFLFILGIVITIIEYTGGAAACAKFLAERLSSARSAQCASILLSFSLAIDDYLSVLSVGYIMRPIFDRFAIARVKLAWLIHALSGPLVIIAPLSTWLALVLTQLENAGVSTKGNGLAKIAEDPYVLFLKTTPFVIYSLLTIATVLFIVTRKVSFGPMKEAEESAIKPEATTELPVPANASALTLIAPIITLIASFILGIAYRGNHRMFGGTHSMVQALQSADHIAVILLISGCIALVVSIIVSLSKGVFNLRTMFPATLSGITAIAPSILVVFLASVLGCMTRLDLQTGTILANVLQGILHPWLLPAATFLGSLGMALATGSAWGTIALMTPIGLGMVTTLSGLALPLTVTQFPLILPVLGAIFSGAVCGNHLSPFADISILAATSAGCSVLDHLKTQTWYAIPAVVGTVVGFLVVGIGIGQMGIYASLITAYGLGLFTTLGLMMVLRK